MKFRNFKQSKPHRQKKIPARVPTRSIYLRRDNKNPSKVRFLTSRQPTVVKTISMKGSIYGRTNAKVIRNPVRSNSPLLGDTEQNYNPFLFDSRPPVVDRCVSRINRRQVLFARGVAGIGKRRSPGKDGHYAPSEGPCDRRI